MENLGKKIQDLRISCNLSLEQMGYYLGIRWTTLNLKELDIIVITLEELESIQNLCEHQCDLSQYNIFDLQVIASINKIARNSDLMSKLLRREIL